MSSKIELTELTNEDPMFKAIGGPRIIDYSRDNAEERSQAVEKLASSFILEGGRFAYRLGEVRVFVSENSRSWHQAIQFYKSI